jgi:hypothetical protein
MGLPRPTKADEDALWRTHFCVPRSHSCERLGLGRQWIGVFKGARPHKRQELLLGQTARLVGGSHPILLRDCGPTTESAAD